jgi:hypothetical protein
MMRGEMRRSCDLADQVLAFSERGNNIAHQLEAHHAQWTSRLLVGEPAAALKHCKRGDELYRQKEHHALTHTYGGHDPGVCGANVGAHALWLLGYPVKSKSRVRSSLALARELNHTTTLADAINMAMLIASFDSDLPMLRATAAELRELSTSERLQDYATLAGIAEGWALTEEGKIETGFDLIRRSAPILIDQGDPWTPSLIGLCAVALGRHGAPSEGLHLLDVALPHFHAKQAHWWDAELYRIKGELLANSEDGDEDEESCLRRALKIAGNQKAKSLELRAAVSLARLLRDRGKQALAREALEPVYSWFTEGFDSPDLTNAKLVLKDLS